MKEKILNHFENATKSGVRTLIFDFMLYAVIIIGCVSYISLRIVNPPETLFSKIVMAMVLMASITVAHFLLQYLIKFYPIAEVRGEIVSLERKINVLDYEVFSRCMASYVISRVLEYDNESFVTYISDASRKYIETAELSHLSFEKLWKKFIDEDCIPTNAIIIARPKHRVWTIRLTCPYHVEIRCYDMKNSYYRKTSYNLETTSEKDISYDFDHFFDGTGYEMYYHEKSYEDFLIPQK